MFLPKFHQFFSYERGQPKSQPIENKIHFKKFTSFEVVFRVRDCLLVFDNLREEIFNDKKLSKLETAGRHKNLS